MGCFGFLKAMMFIFNGLIFVAGAALLGVGIWVKVDSGSVLGLLQKFEGASGELSQLLNVGYLLIAVGAVLLVIGFLGCCGAVRESRCMLLLFFIIILLIFLAEVAGAVVILVFKPVAERLIKKLGNEAVKSIKMDFGANADVTGLWNTTMDTLHCCGFYNYTDFNESPFYKQHNAYPSQCCPSMVNPCTAPTVYISGALNMTILGCGTKILTLIDENAVGIIAVALGIAALEVCAMVVSMILYCKIGSKRG
ncbi:hypothetical protein CRUP_011349 [Coryphaenoides rupestris]|nr:hypothetical protein CRUP_011349 [Coryphaenoides rupestris]